MTDTAPTLAARSRYASASALDAQNARFQLFADLERPPVALEATLTDPIGFREALSTLYRVVQSDFRYKPKDRTAYMAYQRMKKATAGASQWEAQAAYFDWLAENDPDAWLALDPVVTVHPDALMFEVFAKDEGTYAQLKFDLQGPDSMLDVQGKVTPGVTNVDFSEGMFDTLQRMRSHADARFVVGQNEVALETAGEKPAIEKKLDLPESWLRGFLQVQSAATLARTKVELAPIDVYNVLRHLRLNKDKRRGKGGRAIRVELVPGQAPRLVLEPWETVLEASTGPYTGRTPSMVRIWGRRRLSMLARFVPYITAAELHVMGSGMPSFLVARGKGVTLTLGLTGFTAQAWSQGLFLDTLLPRDTLDDADRVKTQKKVLTALGKVHAASADDLAAKTKVDASDTRAALQAACQMGQAVYDIADGLFRARTLLEQPLPLAQLAFRSDDERRAADYLATDGAVSLDSVEDVFGEGTVVRGTVKDAADKREYAVQFTVADDGRVFAVDCTSAKFRTHKLKQGPSAPLIAVCKRFHALRLAKARGELDPHTITVETKVFGRRSGSDEDVVHVALNKKRLRVRFGKRSDVKLRMQQLVFASVDDARTAYFDRCAALERQGYLDATGA